jgi:hypothetical protein
MPDQETPASAEPDQSANGETETSDEAPPEFANRAERRAKGKGRSAQSQHAHGTGPVAGSHGPAQARRNYGTRRTGG